MSYAGRMVDCGRGGWLIATALAFALCWPVGLAILIVLSCSGRWGEVREEMRALKADYRARRDAMRRDWRTGGGWGGGNWNHGDDRRGRRGGSGNAAFDEYRAETLRRLEEEQREFEEYLERLRAAKDKAEFDAFMAQRRGIVPG